MESSDKHHSYRRLSADNAGSPCESEVLGLHRTRSVRASFRRLGARWKTPAPKTPAPKPNTNQPPGSIDEVFKENQLNNKHISELVDKVLTPVRLVEAPSKPRFDKHYLSHYKSDIFGRTKKAKHLKRIGASGPGGLRTGSKENYWPMDLPNNVPSKAAAILEIPMSSEQFNRDTSAWFMSNRSTTVNPIPSGPAETIGFGGQFRFLKRSVSLNQEPKKEEDDKEKPRTATIRRGSVWANSTLKLTLPDIVTKRNASSKLPKPPDMNMEFLMPQLPAVNSKHSSTTHVRQNTATNGSILQSAINSLNSRNTQPISANTTNRSSFQLSEKSQSSTSIQFKETQISGNGVQFIKNHQQQHTMVSATSIKGHSLPPQSLPPGLLMNLASTHPALLATHTKMTKKQLKLAQAQLDKLTQINIHLHALFAAVENGHLDKARTILESTDVDVNSLNSDGLSPLDVAVLSNNRSMTKMLLQHGAIEGTQFKTSDSLGNHLNGLLQDAENRVYELSGGAGNNGGPSAGGGLGGSGAPTDDPNTMQLPAFSNRASFSSIIGNVYPGPSAMGCSGSEADRQIGLWERRVKGLRRMLLGWDQTRPPDPPQAIQLDVTSVTVVTLRIQESVEGPIATKCKVQWSSRADFSNIVGEREVSEWTSFQGTMGSSCRIADLTQGRRYYFRASCGNVKGWGGYRGSSPSSVIPSSWRDMDNKEPRFAGRQRMLDELFTAVRLARPDDASEFPMETAAIQRRLPKKKTTIKQLFSAASKFQKNLRRGIYMACILYHEDKVLVTNEDFVPVIEIDETYPSCLTTDYHWLMKVACTWDDVKSLRSDMEKNSTSATHFRTKLLAAACQMQSALCLQDLGQLFHRPLRDSHGTVVVSCVNHVKTPKSVSVLNSRWIPLNKVQKKIVALHEDNHINEILLSSIQEQIAYHQSSVIRLPKGLYLGYLKMQSSVDQIQIVVPVKTPNVLPHCKIRENPHISAEEWEFLRRNKVSRSYEPAPDKPTEVQENFLEALTHSAHRLFRYMDIQQEHAFNHRLFDLEVIELSPEVSFLIVCPPADSCCAVPGQREILLQRGDLLSLPVQAFEMIHLRTYHNGIIQKYARLSCILELDTVLANHSHREAFSKVEVQLAKERLAKLHDLSKTLNAVWKGVRWLMDVIGFARDRCGYLGLNMKEIFNFKPQPSLSSQESIHSSPEKPTIRNNDPTATESDAINDDDNDSRHFLQPPSRSDTKLMKSSPGRGSWPGPSHSLGTNGLLNAEHSKSEQQLSLTTSNLSSRYLSATSGFEPSSRKNSADSNCSHRSGNSYYSAGESVEHIPPRLPPSRSEDTLAINKRSTTIASASALHRKRSTTVNSNSTFTSSPISNIRPVSYISPSAAKMGSAQSLSSDSEGTAQISCPITTSTPTEKSMLERVSGSTESVRSRRQLFEGEGHKNDSIIFKEPLFIAEEDHPTTSDRVRKLTVSKTPQTDSTRNGNASSSSSSAATTAPVPSSGIIQVFAAYDTGLPNGTSLKLHVTPKTSAREVVDLVVKQLNMAVVLKGKDGPIYTAEKLNNFCLVAVIGARERCLRDDFKPLQLQNPWKKGRLYVRQKHDLLAAIEHSNRDAQLI